MAKEDRAIREALERFAQSVTENMTTLTSGEPEEQLRSPFWQFVHDVGDALGRSLHAVGETRLPGRLGIPDYAIEAENALLGYAELKAPGHGANATRFKGHDHQQFKRFEALPNLIYTDGNEWALYRRGERISDLIRLSGDATTDGQKAIGKGDVQQLKGLLTDFLAWQPIVPSDAKELAETLAPICRMLRHEVADALGHSDSPLVRLASDWRKHLFPEADDDRFADAYAQTVTYALLLARAEGADTMDLHEAIESLQAQHTMLSRALEVLTDRQAQEEIRPALRLVQRVVAAVEPQTLATDGKADPWLYFYEDFLAAYDSKLRKDAGAYYTPVEVVNCQVRLIDELLRDRLDTEFGYAEGSSVVTLDPAAGTGTYLLAVVDHALRRVAEEEGEGAVRARASILAQNVHGFEILVSPRAVAELRLTQAFTKRNVKLPQEGPNVYLTNTLESPHTDPPAPPLFYQPIAFEHERALRVKDRTPVIVCLGNPPYDRHERPTEDNRAMTGGWVRWGDNGKGDAAILDDFIEPAKRAGHGGHLKNLYNLYVYFWRWALWKTFEHKTSPGPGVVSYISASSYIDGDAFAGMRQHMREICDEIWIIDLGGEGRGTRREENVFDIQTPVAIAVAFRGGIQASEAPATVRYTRIEGTRREKLQRLDTIGSFDDLSWEACPEDWQAPFRPAGQGAFFDWPQLVDLMPWQQSGVKVGRTWPVAPDRPTLERRWQILCKTAPAERAEAFVNRPTGRKVGDSAKKLPPEGGRHTPLLEVKEEATPPPVYFYGYRSFDRQCIFRDGRLIDRPGPGLWHALGDWQVYLTTLFSQPLGVGPALTASASIPDLDHFRGSYGAKAVLPLYRDPQAEHPNLLPGLLEWLAELYGHEVTPEDWVAYLYGVLAQPAYTERFAEELINREIRVPITKDADLFQQVAEIGRYLLWLHTYGERFVPKGRSRGRIPKGRAKCAASVPDDPESYPDTFSYDEPSQTLHVGAGQFTPVAPEVWDFEVSGLKVVQSWLGYRMRQRAGKRSSPLDDIQPERWTAEFTSELLHLLWILEYTLDTYPQQAELLEQVLAGPLVAEDELPPVPDEARKAPKPTVKAELWE